MPVWNTEIGHKKTKPHIDELITTYSDEVVQLYNSGKFGSDVLTQAVNNVKAGYHSVPDVWESKSHMVLYWFYRNPNTTRSEKLYLNKTIKKHISTAIFKASLQGR